MATEGTELWLVRHGETEWSRNGKHTSVTDLPLTDEGERVARGLPDKLAGVEFDLVLTSPRLRARRTSELAGHGDAEVDEDLVEWAYGDYEGITTPEIRETDPGWSVWTHPTPNGESAERGRGAARPRGGAGARASTARWSSATGTRCGRWPRAGSVSPSSSAASSTSTPPPPASSASTVARRSSSAGTPDPRSPGVMRAGRHDDQASTGAPGAAAARRRRAGRRAGLGVHPADLVGVVAGADRRRGRRRPPRSRRGRRSRRPRRSGRRVRPCRPAPRRRRAARSPRATSRTAAWRSSRPARPARRAPTRARGRARSRAGSAGSGHARPGRRLRRRPRVRRPPGQGRRAGRRTWDGPGRPGPASGPRRTIDARESPPATVDPCRCVRSARGASSRRSGRARTGGARPTTC